MQQKFGHPPPAELKPYHRKQNVAPTAILTGDVWKRVKGSMPPGSRERRPRRSERWEGWLSGVGQLVRDGETTEKEGWGREDENSKEV